MASGRQILRSYILSSLMTCCVIMGIVLTYHSTQVVAQQQTTPSTTTRLPILTVTGEGTSKAPLTWADITLRVQVHSRHFGTDEFQDIEPFGDNVPVLPDKSDYTHEFYFTQQHLPTSIHCTSCVYKEVTRRTTSLLNYIHWLNSTDLSTFSLAAHDISTSIQPNPRGNGFTHLRTGSITTRPEHKWVNNENKLMGYIGTATIRVRVPIHYSHYVVNKALDVGASHIDGVELFASDDEIVHHQQLADAKAAKVAFQRAQSVLQALHLDFQGIQSINIGHGHGNRMSHVYSMESAMMTRSSDVAGGVPAAYKSTISSSMVGDNNIISGEDISIPGNVSLEIVYTNPSRDS